jgi:hypothetical protein
MDYDLNYFMTMSKTSTSSNEKNLNQENSKSTIVWQDAKITCFFIANIIILQFMSPKFLRNFSCIPLVV